MAASSAIREFVTFESERFDQKPKPHTINPCCRCEDVAAWLFEAVRTLPGFTFGGFGQEDFGWIFEARPEGARSWFLVAIQTFDEPDGPARGEYGLHVAPQSGEGFFKKLFGGAQSDGAHIAPELALCRAIDFALRSEPLITKIAWWSEGFEVGSPGDHPDP